MNPYFIIILAGIVFLGISFTLATVFLLVRGGKRSRLTQRLDEIKRVGISPTIILEAETKNKFVNALITCGRFIAPRREAKRIGIEKKLHTAGFYSGNAVLIFMGLRVLLPAILFLIVILLFILLRLQLLVAIAAAVCSILLGIWGPLLVLRIIGHGRKSEIVKGFPDAMDLLAVCAEAGVGFDNAIKRVAEDMALSNKHISREFMYYIYETQMGISRHEALRNLANRTDADIIRSFIILLIQSDKLGTSIVNTLRVYSDSLRVKRRQDAETKAARLPVLMVFPLLFFIFPSLYVVILGPATISILKNIITKWH